MIGPVGRFYPVACKNQHVSAFGEEVLDCE
jgi:hypothetical protein